MTDRVGFELGEVEAIIAEEDGYAAEANGGMLLRGIGLAREFDNCPMKEIPQDMQFKTLFVCQDIFGSPEALILDEPTNHLDLASGHVTRRVPDGIQRDSYRC